MSTVSSITPHLQELSCPAPLRSLQGWLIWRYEKHDGEAKPRKTPYYVGGGRRHGVQGSHADRAKLTTFAAACSAAARKGFDGVGIALMPEFGVTALDFDNCVTGDGITPAVADQLTGTYSEFSPSGKGVRAFVVGDLGNRKSNDPSHPFGFETFSSKGFVTFTGNLTPQCEMLGLENTIAAPAPSTLALHKARFQETASQQSGFLGAPGDLEPLGLTEGQLEEALGYLDPDCTRAEWITAGLAIHHEAGGAGFHLWDSWSAQGSKYPGAEAAEKQWDSFGRSGTANPVTARSLIKMANDAGARITSTAQLAGAEDFDDVSGQPAPDTPPPRYTFIQADKFSHGKPLEWIVRDLLPRAELGVLYGAPGSGKTFWVLDLALAVAQSMPWNDHRVKGGGVAYIAAEGAGGVRKRLRAYAEYTGTDLAGVPLHVLGSAPNFLDKRDATDLIRAAQALGPLVLIIIDTYASVMPGGNENSGEDAGLVIANCKLLAKVTGAMVLLVHHSGKDTSKGARGWSGMLGACDVEIEVSRDAVTDERAAVVTKMKDGDDTDQVYGFKLNSVTLAQRDADGEEITSCVVLPAVVHGRPRADRKRTGLDDAYDSIVAALEAGDNIERDIVNGGIIGGGARKAKQVFDKLVGEGRLSVVDGVVALPGAM